MIVAAMHPAPVAHLPARARKVRLDLVRIVTPVSLAEADAGAFEPLGRIGKDARFVPMELSLHDGRVWTPLLVRGLGGRAEPLGADGFAAYAEGRAAEAIAEQLDREFCGTPLVANATAPAPRHFPTPEPTRGADVSLDASRSIGIDHRGAAAGALVGWFADNLRVVEGRMYRRRRPLAVVTGSDEAARVEIWDGGKAIGYRTLNATPGNLPAMLEQVRARREPVPASSPEVRAWLERVPQAAVAAEDARTVLDGYAGTLRLDLEGGPGTLGPVAADDELRAAMAGLEILAMTGQAGAAGEIPALQTFLRALAALSVHEDHADLGHGRFAGYVAGVLLPGLADAVAGDVDDLSSLAP